MYSFRFIMFQIKEYLTNIKPLEIQFRKDINTVYLIDKKILFKHLHVIKTTVKCSFFGNYNILSALLKD